MKFLVKCTSDYIWAYVGMTLKNLEAGRPNQSCHVKNPAIAEKFHNAHMFKKYQRYTVKEAQAKKKNLDRFQCVLQYVSA